MTRTLLLASALLQQALSVHAQSPHGEAIIYEGREFAGRSFALRNDTANFEYIGCRDFGPGRYPMLPGSLRNKLSSAVPR